MTDPHDTTYGSDADLLEESGSMWKARAEKAEAEVVELRQQLQEARGAAAAWAGQAMAEHGPVVVAAVLREREECATVAKHAAMTPAEQRLNEALGIRFSHALTMFEAGRNAAERAIRARSK